MNQGKLRTFVYFSTVGMLGVGALIFGIILKSQMVDDVDIFDILENQGTGRLSHAMVVYRPEADFAEAKDFFSNLSSPRKHPAYAQVDELLQKAVAVLDDTANPELRDLIDYRRMMQEENRQFELLEPGFGVLHNVSSAEEINNIMELTIGPTSFGSYQIYRIQGSEKGDLKVYFGANVGYDFMEPVVWRLSRDSDGNLKVFDWFALELGVPNSAESAYCYGRNSDKFREYSKLSDRYFQTEELIPPRRYVETLRVLSQMESAGPPPLAPMTRVITARRLLSESEPKLTLDMLERIVDPQRAPGAFRLKGTILLRAGKLDQALEQFEKYCQTIGPFPDVLSLMARCHQLQGNQQEQKKILARLFEQGTIRSGDLAMLIRMCEQDEAARILDQIVDERGADAAGDLFETTLDWLDDEELLASEHDFLSKNLDQKIESEFGKRYSARQLSPEGWPETFAAIEALTEEEQSAARTKFWTSLAPENIQAAFAESRNTASDFRVLTWMWNEDNLSESSFAKIVQLAADADPENSLFGYYAARAKFLDEEYELAIAMFKKLIANIGEDQEQSESLIRGARYYVTSALVHTGDTKSVLDFAKSNDTVQTALDQLESEGDFSIHAELIAELDDDSPEKRFHEAILTAQGGDTVDATRQLIRLWMDTSAKEGVQDYQYIEKALEFGEFETVIDQLDVTVDLGLWDILKSHFYSIRDWQAFDRVANLETIAMESNDILVFKRRQLRQEKLFFQGQYDKVTESPAEFQSLAKMFDARVEFENQVRSAIRMRDLEQADKIVSVMPGGIERDYLKAMVLVSGDAGPEAEMPMLPINRQQDLQIESELDRERIAMFADANNWRPPYMTIFERWQNQGTRLFAYETRPNLNQETIETLFGDGFGPVQKVSSVKGTEATNDSSDDVFSDVVTEDYAFRLAVRKIADEDKDSIKTSKRARQLFGKAEYILAVSCYQRKSHARARNFRVLNKVTRSFTQSSDAPGVPIAAGSSYSWLSERMLAEWFSTQKDDVTKDPYVELGDKSLYFSFDLDHRSVKPTDEQARKNRAKMIQDLRQFTVGKMDGATVIVELGLGSTNPFTVRATLQEIFDHYSNSPDLLVVPLSNEQNRCVFGADITNQKWLVPVSNLVKIKIVDPDNSNSADGN